MRLVLDPLFVLSRLDHIVERALYLCGRLGLIDVDFRNLNTGGVIREVLLQTIPHLKANRRATLGQNKIHGGVTHHMTQRTLCCMLQRHFRITNLQNKGAGVINNVLHRHADLNNILVLGQHDFPQTGSTHFRRVHFHDFVDKRRIPLQAGSQRSVVLAETQHHSTLLLIQLVKAHQAPHHENTAKNDAQERARHAALCGSGTAPAATEQPSNLLLQLFKRLIEIRWALIPATPRVTRAVITAPGLIPRHRSLPL